MKKVKIEYIVLVAVIAALAAYLALRGDGGTHYDLPELPAVAGGDISRIEIEKGGKTLRLLRDGERWLIGENRYPADGTKVEAMLGIFEKFTLTALVSESKNYGRYDLGEEKRVAITAWAGEEKGLSFAAGKAAPSYRHTFVTVEGDHRVFHARESFRNDFDVSEDDLRDKVVLSFEAGDIRRIELSAAGGTPVALTPKAPEDGGEKAPAWTDEGGEERETAKVEKLLRTLSKLRCDGYLAGKTEADLADPLHTIRLTGKDDTPMVLSLHAGEKEGAYGGTSSQNDYPFTVSGYQAEDLVKGLTELTE